MPLITDPIDLLLDNTGDLDISDGIDLSFSSGTAGVAQAIRVRLQLVMGEWFANLEAGVDWVGKIWGQKFDAVVVTNEMRKAILDAPGVGTINTLTATFDRQFREVTINWDVTSVFGDTVADSLSQSA